MLNNSSKILFLMTLISGSIITISSNSWIGAWMGLEINLLSFIPLMIDSNNLMSTEAALKYFLTQALASSLLLFFIIFFLINFNFITMHYIFNKEILIFSTLLLKTGAPPFHFWFPNVMEGLSWFNNFILMTWQKLAPLILMSYCLYNNYMIFYIIILSSLVGALGGLNQTSLRKLMAFSSISHVSWIILAIMNSEFLFFFYYFLYTFLSLAVIYMFQIFNIFYFNQIFSLSMENNFIKYSIFLTLLSLGGLPPFLGFLPKWILIEQMILKNYIFLMVFMIIMSAITLYFYLRLSMTNFLLNYSKLNFKLKLNFKNINFFLILIFTFFSITGLTLFNLIYN